MNAISPTKSEWLLSTTGVQSPIQRLFNRLDAFYPIKFRSSFSCESQIMGWYDAWAEALSSEQITYLGVKRGLDLCVSRNLIWPPSLPEFIALCRPPIHAETAYREAIVQIYQRELGRDSWSHPAIYFAAQSVTFFDLKQLTYQQIRGRWIAALEKQLAQKSWDLIPSSTKMLSSACEKPTQRTQRECDTRASYVLSMRQALAKQNPPMRKSI